jgi:hypothetical protein
MTAGHIGRPKRPGTISGHKFQAKTTLYNDCQAKLPGTHTGHGCRERLPGTTTHCRAQLPGKTAGHDCLAKLSGSTAGQNCRARLPGMTAGHIGRPNRPGTISGQNLQAKTTTPPTTPITPRIFKSHRGNNQKSMLNNLSARTK